MTAEVIPFRIPPKAELHLELLLRNGEAKRFAVRVEQGTRRIVRLLEADRPVEAHQIASAICVEARKAIRRLPDGPEDVA